MKKVINRLIVFSIGFPLLLVVVVFFPHYNHLILNIITIVFSVLGAVELRNILTNKNLVISVPEAIILGALIPASWTMVVSFGFNALLTNCAAVFGAIWLLVSGVFKSQKITGDALNRITAGVAVMIYPGLFMAWIIRMAVFPRAEIVIVVFLIAVLLNDSAAWVFGMLFGKTNRGIIRASPKKSIAGFVGGLIASIVIVSLAALIFPDAFTSKFAPGVLKAAILGLVTGCAAIFGDLGESVLKRSAGVKDSGTLILGRGGALDSIDSLVLAAPVYYIIYLLLFVS